MTCTSEDHDTTDPYCGGCGIPLNREEQCEECMEGRHLTGHPFCTCCGEPLEGKHRWTIRGAIWSRIKRRLRRAPASAPDWGLSQHEKEGW